MARTTTCSFVFSAILVFLAIGCDLSQATECTNDNIGACTFPNKNGCRFYHKEADCLKAIDQSSCADIDLQGLKRVLLLAQHNVDACPGLPDGTCYFNAIQKCENDAGNNNANKSQLCKGFKGKELSKKKCFEDLKPKCKDKYVVNKIEKRIELINKIEKSCASHHDDKKN